MKAGVCGLQIPYENMTPLQAALGVRQVCSQDCYILHVLIPVCSIAEAVFECDHYNLLTLHNGRVETFVAQSA